MKVLVTDDAAFMRMMLKDTIAAQGHEVIEACNGVEMLEKVSAEHPDLCFLDITMPDMDGLTALKELRKRGSDVSVIMCSAMGQQAMVIDAIQNGAKDFIVKPFNKDRIVEALSKFGK